MSEEIGSEVVVVEKPQAIVRAASGDVVDAFEEYRKIQKALDDAMPDCLMQIQGKAFRKKNYWRAIATAFNLTVTIKSEERHEADWFVVYTASAANGRNADGDGSCSMDEKRGAMATVHNVRAHAHTRAYNRAVSNLVGFGEVSAEEMIESRPRATSPPPATGGRTITEKQRKRLYAISISAGERLGVPAEQVDDYAKGFIRQLGFESSKDLTKEPYDMLCGKLEMLTLNDLVPPADDEPPPAKHDPPLDDNADEIF
jgi:hypothetical protein